VIYSRVSTSLQDNQRAILELKGYAKQNGYVVLEVFSETITGASKAIDRKEFSELVQFVEKNKVHHILIWELSRLGRNAADILNTINFFSDKKVNIYSKKDNIETLSANGERNLTATMFCNFLASFSEFERETTKLRSISGIRANVAKGGSGQGIIKPYGFRSEDKKLIIDEDEAKVIRLIFDLYLKGNGTTKIARHLNDLGIPTKYNKTFGSKTISLRRIEKKGREFKWVDGTIYSILKNTIYKGKRKHNEEYFDITPIIPEEDFDKVQETLKKKYNKIGSNQKYVNPLKEKIICGTCLNTYFLHLRKSLKDKSYKCLTKRQGKICKNPSIGVDKIHNALFELLKSQLISDIHEETQDIIVSNEKRITELRKIIKKLDSEQAKLYEYLEELLDLVLNKLITREEYSERKQSIENKILEINETISVNNESLNQISQENDNLSQLHQVIYLKKSVNNKSTDKINMLNLDEMQETSNEMYLSAINKYVKKIVIHNYENDNIRTIFKNRQDVIIKLEIHFTFSSTPTYVLVSQRTYIVMQEYYSVKFEGSKNGDMNSFVNSLTSNGIKNIIITDKWNNILSFIPSKKTSNKSDNISLHIGNE
jgi:DNA invertase Pin-like site-specific DNA recombinase